MAPPGVAVSSVVMMLAQAEFLMAETDRPGI
jgi:hypothetical protein